jgi:hypothetical protein
MFSRDHCKSYITTMADTLVMSYMFFSLLKFNYAVELEMSHFLQAGTVNAMLARMPYVQDCRICRKINRLRIFWSSFVSSASFSNNMLK